MRHNNDNLVMSSDGVDQVVCTISAARIHEQERGARTINKLICGMNYRVHFHNLMVDWHNLHNSLSQITLLNSLMVLFASFAERAAGLVAPLGTLWVIDSSHSSGRAPGCTFSQ